MTRARGPAGGQQTIRADLVEYLVVSVGDIDRVDGIGSELASLVDAGTIRVLDLVAVARASDGSVSVAEPDGIPALAALVSTTARRQLLSERDIQLAARALPRGGAGIVVVTEDCWAERLSDAAQRAGGWIAAGDRIPPGLVATVLATHADGAEGV
jgi:hypothetical protein